MRRTFVAALALTVAASPAWAQSPACPDHNLMYWQAFPPGGEWTSRRAISRSC